MNVEVCFSKSRDNLAPVFERAFKGVRNLRIVVGFLTKNGLEKTKDVLPFDYLEYLVFGHANISALKAASTLANKIGKDKVYIHLGWGQKKEFTERIKKRYRPMLHSKIYLGVKDDEAFVAFIGSHNLTGYAINGDNAETGVLLEGSIQEETYKSLDSAIRSIRDEATS